MIGILIKIELCLFQTISIMFEITILYYNITWLNIVSYTLNDEFNTFLIERNIILLLYKILKRHKHWNTSIQIHSSKVLKIYLQNHGGLPGTINNELEEA